MSSNLSLEKGLLILNVLKGARESLGVREIARRLDLTPSVAQRLLNTLASHGYVEQESSRRYQIGYAVLGLAQHVFQRGRLLALAEEELKKLAAGGCFNGFLGIRRGSVGVYVLAIQSDSPVVIRAQPGEAMALHSTALGKALLLGMGDTGIRTLLGDKPLERLTERTVLELDKLVDQLRLGRSLGYTTAISENLEGVISVGAPIYDATGSVTAAISVAFPRAVYPKVKITDVAESIVTAAHRISLGLGFERQRNPEEEETTDVAT